MQRQILQFRQIVSQGGFSDAAFALNVDGDAFRRLLAGQSVELEVICAQSGVARHYQSDGNGDWLERFAEDLAAGLFGPTT